MSIVHPGGWLGVKSIPLGKRAELALPLSQPGLRKCRGLNLLASTRMQPSHQLIQGWVATCKWLFVESSGLGRVGF